jgi:tetratricopeptide (TPR) repeat protein
MTKSRILLLLFVVVTTIGLYMLPRYVVNNEQQDVVNEANNNTPATSPDQSRAHDHDLNIPDSLLTKINKFYDSFKNAENLEKRLIFADSLAKCYKIVGKLDSLAKYTEVKAIEIPSIENFIIAGDGYYEAFNFAVDQSKRNLLAEKVQEYYKRVLDGNSSLLDVKSKLAMTYIAGANPMQGITMLREVIAIDPNNEMAIYNLGMLSITSGQYDKAIERFSRLVELNGDSPEANFYMGYCLFELGRKDDSKSYFQKVTEIGISGDLVNASEDYLKRID